MDKIITEIITGAIILALLIYIIPVYRRSAELAVSAESVTDMNENIKKAEILRVPASGDIASGRYVIELAEQMKVKNKAFSITIAYMDHVYVFDNERYESIRTYISDDMFFKASRAESTQGRVEIYFMYITAEEEIIYG